MNVIEKRPDFFLFALSELEWKNLEEAMQATMQNGARAKSVCKDDDIILCIIMLIR